jgi:hypothetical protein
VKVRIALSIVLMGVFVCLFAGKFSPTGSRPCMHMRGSGNYRNLITTFFIYLFGWSGTESAITGVIYWPIVPALDDTG